MPDIMSIIKSLIPQYMVCSVFGTWPVYPRANWKGGVEISHSGTLNNYITLYADDMLPFRSSDQQPTLSRLQQCPARYYNTCNRNVTTVGCCNDLCLKCKVMLITRHRTKGIQMPTLKLYGQPLERVFEYKYLGVVLSANLSWMPQNRSQD